METLIEFNLICSTLILPHTVHIRFQLWDEKLSHFLNLGKCTLGTFDLILIVLGHLIKGQWAFEKKQEKMFYLPWNLSKVWGVYGENL